MLRKLRRLSELKSGELLVFFQLVLFAIAATLFLRFFSLPRLIDILSVASTRSFLKQFPLSHHTRQLSRLLVITDWSARAVRPNGPCLLRSLLLFWMIKARGEQAELVIGICKEARALNSHAWIESQGRIIADNVPLTTGFATLLRF